MRRARPGAPVVVSVHGGDVLSVAHAHGTAARAVTRRSPTRGSCSPTPTAWPSARRALGARDTRVVHLGTDVPPEPAPEPRADASSTVAHLVARKRHADVLRALWLLRDATPTCAG